MPTTAWCRFRVAPTDEAVRRYGRLDIVGVQVQGPPHETSLADWEDLMDTNARGVFLAMKHQIPHLISGGGGQIIVNSPVGALVGRPGLSLYQASKQAIPALVKCAALEYGQQGSRVNAILPGITDTAMIRSPELDDATWEQAKAAVGKLNADGLGTVADPEHIATAVPARTGDEFGYLAGVSPPSTAVSPPAAGSCRSRSLPGRAGQGRAPRGRARPRPPGADDGRAETNAPGDWSWESNQANGKPCESGPAAARR
ncbi:MULTISPECIES: SDR family NAD(P)-dependent oxidoreductase [unclassified Streptomyces]|uniref:SDR family NAD(P)-dependent oxidoreductase n=1 Tax=unclassified Streptomyces TaxID=2593676 RepID=UPI0022B6FEC6|nr:MULTISPECIES: SDR family oxidoreductase [unclassified Streptomyces]MCZ7413696.1 SDR family oxidoreductase [Streptomyces sp. WMMC897]MCZ7430692.1 SDR family oxidoreductase [Streptomyces sp. WMMC1477]